MTRKLKKELNDFNSISKDGAFLLKYLTMSMENYVCAAKLIISFKKTIFYHEFKPKEFQILFKYQIKLNK